MNRTHDRRRGRVDQLARLALAPVVASGTAVCDLCGQLIDAADEWDAGHPTPLALGGSPDQARVAQHARCNRGEGGRLAAELRRGRRVDRRRFL